MKKIKLFSSLFSLATVATSSCSIVLKNNNDKELHTIDIGTLAWIQRPIYACATSEQVEAIIKNDNAIVFARYPGLQEAVTIGALIEGTDISITINATGDLYSGSESWNATTGEQPEPPTPKTGDLLIDTFGIVPQFETNGGATQYSVKAKYAESSSAVSLDPNNCSATSNNTNVLFAMVETVTDDTVEITFVPSTDNMGAVGVTIVLTDTHGKTASVTITCTVTKPIYIHTWHFENTSGTWYTPTYTIQGIMVQIISYDSTYLSYNGPFKWLYEHGYNAWTDNHEYIYPCTGFMSTSSSSKNTITKAIGVYGKMEGTTYKTLYAGFCPVSNNCFTPQAQPGYEYNQKYKTVKLEIPTD